MTERCSKLTVHCKDLKNTMVLKTVLNYVQGGQALGKVSIVVASEEALKLALSAENYDIIRQNSVLILE